MSELPIFEHFLGVWKYQAKIQVVFQDKIFLLNWAPADLPKGICLHLDHYCFFPAFGVHGMSDVDAESAKG